MMKFKKILLALVSLILAVILCGCSNKSYIINSNIDDIEKKVNNNESFILYIGSKECHNCTSFTPKLEKVVKEPTNPVLSPVTSQSLPSRYSTKK